MFKWLKRGSWRRAGGEAVGGNNIQVLNNDSGDTGYCWWNKEWTCKNIVYNKNKTKRVTKSDSNFSFTGIEDWK